MMIVTDLYSSLEG